jgi:1,4-alpha-glucan branching enzyme
MLDQLDQSAIEAIVTARHGDPFAVLGFHDGVVRAFIPGADTVTVIDRQTGLAAGELVRVHSAGFFSGPISTRAPYRLRIGQDGADWETEDPYSFQPILGEMDIYLLSEGRHRDFGRCLGAHQTVLEGVAGVRFAVWAPNAQRVSVVGNFNRWDGRRHPMRKRHGPGVWELFIPRVGTGSLYKFEILGPDGALLPLKADPVAWAAQTPPETASVIADNVPENWTDAEWIASRAARHAEGAPITVYEVHAGSWSPAAAMGVDHWDNLAASLIPYVAGMGFTHIELLPIMEHPFGGSWGYQPLGQFAPSSRLGPPEAFARFVDQCHAAGLGIILDWVPAHFPTDTYGLAQFDGTALYEHQDPREGFQRDWNTLIYNLGRNEVRAFLIGSALFWLEHYHVDGIRVDAVASMLYRD